MRVDHFEAVTQFGVDEGILLTIGPQIKELQNILSAKFQLLNVPKEAPPDVPRIIITIQNAQIQISLVRFNIVVKPPEHINTNFNSSCDFMSNLVEKVLPRFIFDNFKYEWTGIVSFLEAPSLEKGKGSMDLITPIFDRLLNVRRNERQLASFELKFGFREGEYFRNFTISGYDSYQIPISIKPGSDKYHRIDITKDFIIESGINLGWDINNRPSKSKIGALQDFKGIINELKANYAALPGSLNLEGLIL